jgi:hypothetical protein
MTKSILFICLIAISSCRNKEEEGFTPLSYTPFFKIENKKNEDPFKNWPKEDLALIQFKSIGRNPERYESDWKPITYYKTDSFTIFSIYALHDTTFIKYPSINHMDTIAHQRILERNNNGSVIRVKDSKFYFNGKLAAEINFDADNTILPKLSKTNKEDSLRKDTYIMGFKWE